MRAIRVGVDRARPRSARLHADALRRRGRAARRARSRASSASASSSCRRRPASSAPRGCWPPTLRGELRCHLPRAARRRSRTASRHAVRRAARRSRAMVCPREPHRLGEPRRTSPSTCATSARTSSWRSLCRTATGFRATARLMSAFLEAHQRSIRLTMIRTAPVEIINVRLSARKGRAARGRRRHIRGSPRLRRASSGARPVWFAADRPTDTSVHRPQRAARREQRLAGPLVVTQIRRHHARAAGQPPVGRRRRQPADRGRCMSPPMPRSIRSRWRSSGTALKSIDDESCDRADQERLLDQHQGAPRPLDRRSPTAEGG